MKNLFIVALSASMLIGCVSKGKYETLQSQLDSVAVELDAANQLVSVFEQVTTIMDQVELNQEDLALDLESGAEATDYVAKMDAIQNQMNQANQKVAALEAEVGSNNSLITKLKAQVAQKNKEIASLKATVEEYAANLQTAQDSNAVLVYTISVKDAELADQDELIQRKREELAALEARIEGMSKSALISEADALFARGEALELAANRTQLAPRKKRETLAEALTLFEKSLALGKAEAQAKIDAIKPKLD